MGSRSALPHTDRRTTAKTPETATQALSGRRISPETFRLRILGTETVVAHLVWSGGLLTGMRFSRPIREQAVTRIASRRRNAPSSTTGYTPAPQTGGGYEATVSL